jgi:hypothetical protein
MNRKLILAGLIVAGAIALTTSTQTSLALDQTYYPDATNGVIEAEIDPIEGKDCLNLRAETQMNQVIRCMPRGEQIQVVLTAKNEVVTTSWGHQYAYVLAFDGSKGWAEIKSIKAKLSPTYRPVTQAPDTCADQLNAIQAILER